MATKPRTRTRKAEPDFLDEIIAESARTNPEFPRMVEAAYRRRRLLARLVRIRERRNLKQKDVAERMGTSQAEVSRIESGEVDLRSSTLERYALAVGQDIRYQLSPVRG